MLNSDWFLNGIILTCLFFLSQLNTEARRYDKCTTLDGREGVCVVKRYCREATNHDLLPCEGDEENHCCPIPTTQRSAQSPQWPPPERPRDEELPQPSPKPTTISRHDETGRPFQNDHDKSRQDGSNTGRNYDRSEGTPNQRDRLVPEITRNQGGPDEKDRRRQEDRDGSRDDRNTRRQEVDRGESRGQHDDRDRNLQEVSKEGGGSRDVYNDRNRRRQEVDRDGSGGEYDDRDRRRPNLSVDDDRRKFEEEQKRPDVHRDRDRSPRPGDKRDNDRPGIDGDRIRTDQDRRSFEHDHVEPGRVRNQNRPRPEPDERDSRRPTVFKEPPRDDRLNKTPPPGDRRSPTRHQVQRPPERDVDDYENDRRRQPKPQEPIDRDRNIDRNRRPSSPRPAGRDREKPLPVRFYPSTDELDIHKDSDPRRKPDRKRNDSEDSSKRPIRFPDTYELSVPRPKVPACGVKPYELFIAGGQESDENEWPWMTAIFRRHPDSRPKTFLCGGSLINTKYVLTAAHCFINNYVVLPASSFVVRLGSHQLDSGEEYTVSNLVIHHNHSGSDFFNDIALVRLASEVYVTDKIAPACLPYPEMMQHNLVGRMATVAGWGDVSFRSNGDRILQHVTVPIVSGEECFAAYSRVRGAAFLARGSDHVICAGLREGGKDACLGDSGGPLMLKMADDRWVVVGIVSLGYKCAEPGYPGVYTRVTHYMSWINTNMKKR